MLGSKGILARQTLYKFLTQKGDELMLEVKNLTFQVNENGIERSIVENISFNVEDGEMLVITRSERRWQIHTCKSADGD